MTEIANRTEENKGIESLLKRYLDLEFVDDVTEFKCGRCERVVIRHYLSNCEHAFCFNCKKILEIAGKYKWKCSVCREYIFHVDHQSVELDDKVKALRAHCPNKKYGCKFLCSIKEMPEHLKECRNTREAALPAIYTGTNTMDAVLKQILKINKKIEGINEGINVISDMIIMLDNVDGDNEKRVDSIMDKADENRAKVDQAMMSLKNDVNGVQSRLQVETTRLQNSIETAKTDINTHNTNEMTVKLAELTQTIRENTDNVSKQMKTLETSQNAIIEQQQQLVIDHNNLKIEAKLKSFEEMLNILSIKNTNIESEHQQLALKFQAYQTQLNWKTDFLAKVSDQKEESLNHKLLQSRVEIEQLLADEKVSRIAEIERKTVEINNQIKDTTSSTREELAKVTGQVTALDVKLKSTVETAKSEVEMKLSSLETELQRLLKTTQPIPIEEKTLVYSLKLTDVKQKMEQTTYEWESEVFPFNGYNFGAKVKFHLNENDIISMSLCFVDFKNTSLPMGVKVTPKIYYILRDKSGGVEVKDIIRTSDYSINSVLSYEQYCYEEWLVDKSSLMSYPYAIDDSVVVDVLVETSEFVQQSYSKDGVLMWKIDDYKKVKSMEKEELISYQPSPYFYTSPRGHRVQVRLGLDGFYESQGKGMIAVIKFLTGEFDSFSEIFDHRTTVTIFNQRNPAKHLVKSVQYRKKKDSNNYYIEIAPIKKIENGGFIVNDSLQYKVVIEPLPLK